MMTVEEAREHIGAVVRYAPPPPARGQQITETGVLRDVGPRVVAVLIGGRERLTDPRYLELVPPSPEALRFRTAAERLRHVAEQARDLSPFDWRWPDAREALQATGFYAPDLALLMADWLGVIAEGDGLGLTYHADVRHADRIARRVLGERAGRPAGPWLLHRIGASEEAPAEYATLQEARDAVPGATWHPTLEGYVTANNSHALHAPKPAALVAPPGPRLTPKRQERQVSPTVHDAELRPDEL